MASSSASDTICDRKNRMRTIGWWRAESDVLRKPNTSRKSSVSASVSWNCGLHQGILSRNRTYSVSMIIWLNSRQQLSTCRGSDLPLASQTAMRSTVPADSSAHRSAGKARMCAQKL